MRHSVHLLTVMTLLTVSACHHPASPLAGTAQVRASAGSHARSVAGRALVSWKDAASRRATLARLGVKESQAVGTGGDEVLQLPGGMDPAEFRREVGDAALAVEPDYIMRLPALVADEAEAFDLGSEAKKRAQPGSRAQYAMQKVGAPAAWKIQRGRSAVKIAIIDTGADMEHPDLKNQIVASTSMLGWKSRLGFASARDDNGHGTHCAGVAAAEADNNEGIDGMAPGCKLLIVKTLGADGSGATSDIARGVHWAIDQGASVISMSVGSSDDAKPMREAVQRALAAGIVVVAAMGNEGKQIKNFPAAYPGVIAVGATNSSDKPAGYSTKGSWISVAAPGTGIWSTTPTYKVALNGDGDMTATYGKLSGTSMATPLVAGIAALLKSQHANWSPAQIKQSIERTAVALEGGFNNRTGHGRVSASAALGSRKAE